MLVLAVVKSRTSSAFVVEDPGQGHKNNQDEDLNSCEFFKIDNRVNGNKKRDEWGNQFGESYERRG